MQLLGPLIQKLSDDAENNTAVAFAEAEQTGSVLNGRPPTSPPIDSIITLMSVWRITGKIIRTTIMLITYARVQ